MAVSLTALIVACVSLVAWNVAGVLSLRILRRRHPEVWVEIGRPYIPFTVPGDGNSYQFWLNRKGYLDTDDEGLIRLSRFMAGCFWTGGGGAVVALVALR